MKMKALVKTKPEPGIWLQDVTIPEIFQRVLSVLSLGNTPA